MSEKTSHPASDFAGSEDTEAGQKTSSPDFQSDPDAVTPPFGLSPLPDGAPSNPLAPAQAAQTDRPAGQVFVRSETPAKGDRQSEEIQPGTVIGGRYCIEQKLGEGGMGVVYLGKHLVLQKPVAVKVLSDDFARKEDLRQRFVQEAQAASSIGHENVIEIYDFGDTPSGSVFFAMELLEGADLAYQLRKHRSLEFPRIRHIMIQICQALGAAHAKGIVHRDLKPENVYLVERRGDPDFVKVLDFGIAKVAANSDSQGGSRITRTGVVFGTPEYMAPEQARGERADFRVDIYAAGCMLYELLTGDVPFFGESFMNVLSRQASEPPEPPSVRAPDKGIGPDVEAVVMRALEKDPDLRFPSMKEFAIAIASCAGGDAADGWHDETPRRISGSGTEARAGVGRTSEPSLPPRTASSPMVVAPSRSRSLLRKAGFAAALLAASGLTAAISWMRSERRAPVTQTAPLVPVVIVVKSVPAGAEVFRGTELLGTTPLELKLGLEHSLVAMVLHRADFEDQAAMILPDRNRVYQFELKPIAAASPIVTAPPAVAPAPNRASQKMKKKGWIRRRAPASDLKPLTF